MIVGGNFSHYKKMDKSDIYAESTEEMTNSDEEEDILVDVNNKNFIFYIEIVKNLSTAELAEIVEFFLIGQRKKKRVKSIIKNIEKAKTKMKFTPIKTKRPNPTLVKTKMKRRKRRKKN
jgi:hypothetical protein